MSYSLDPWLKRAIADMPLRERVRFRWRLHVLLRRLSRLDDRLAAIANRMDCGAELADYITGGRVTRIERQMKPIRDELRTMIEPLRERYHPDEA